MTESILPNNVTKKRGPNDERAIRGSSFAALIIFFIIYLPPWLWARYIVYIQPIDVLILILIPVVVYQNIKKYGKVLVTKTIARGICFLLAIALLTVFSQLIDLANGTDMYSYKDVHYLITILKYIATLFIVASLSFNLGIEKVSFLLLLTVLLQCLIFVFQYYDIFNINKWFSTLYQQFVIFEALLYHQEEGRRVTGTFGNPNHSSYILTIGMAWICSIFFYSRKSINKLLSVVTTLLAFIAVVIYTGSRSNGFAMIIMWPISFLIQTMSKRKKIISIAFLVFSLIGIYMLPHAVDYFKIIGAHKRVVRSLADQKKTVKNLERRFTMAERHFVKMVPYQFLVGTGGKTKVDQLCDNGYAQMVVRNGFLCLFVYAAFLLYLIKYFFISFKVAGTYAYTLIASIGILSLSSWLAYEWVADAFWNPQTGQLFFSVVGLCIGYLSYQKKYQPGFQKVKRNG